MYLERLLQINMATMAALGTMLLGMGQRVPTLPMLMLIAAATSVWLTDFTGWFQLNRTLASLVVLGALLFSLQDLSNLQDMTRLNFIAQLLVYLQVILLFRPKDNWIYWQLATVSLLQVVVAAAFNQGAWFGVMLVVYLMVGLSALALFFLHRERLRYLPGAVPAEPPAGPARWPLAAQPSAFCGSAMTARGGPGGELYRRLGAMGVATLLLTVLMFFTVPRIGKTAWRGAAPAQRHAVGFSDQVSLGKELGQVLEDPEEVMRIRFSDAGGRLYQVRGEEDAEGQYAAGVYLRGAVLNDYRSECQDGVCTSSWSCIPSPAAQHELLARGGLIRQHVTIEPMDRQELFCVWPFSKTESGAGLLFDAERQRLLRPRDRCSQRFTYELKTPAFDRSLLEESEPPAELIQEEAIPAFEAVDFEQLLQIPRREDGRSAVPALEELARLWVAESGLEPGDREGRAKRLAWCLRESGRFQYSRHRPPPDSSVDPIEDFVTTNPQGHCEYFATALALMLRSQGIPARVVVGYHCDEFNEVGGFYQVRQLYAHAWVEAYLPASPGQPAPAGRRAEPVGGAWLRLDATPGSPGDRAVAGTSWLGRTTRSLNAWLQSIWGNYVMEMDRSRQREAIYQPLLDWCKATARRLADPAWWRDTLAGIGAGAWQFVLDWIGGDWLSWRGLSALVVFGLVLAGAARLVLALVRRLRRRLSARAARTARAQRARVEFYRRLEAVLARRGLVRAASQTQHEFALAAGATLARATGRGHLAALPVHVADAFYHVRFGGTPLDNQQAQRVEQALAELEQIEVRKG